MAGNSLLSSCSRNSAAGDKNAKGAAQQASQSTAKVKDDAGGKKKKDQAKDSLRTSHDVTDALATRVMEISKNSTILGEITRENPT